MSLTTACLPKIDKDLPSLSEYQQSEGWYEDAFVRVYKRDLQTGGDVVEENFTHPWIVVKRSHSEDIFSFELTGETTPDFSCISFDHVYPSYYRQKCGYVVSVHGNQLQNIDSLEMASIDGEYRVAYRLGELRGGESVNEIAEFILFKSKGYSCRDDYNAVSKNSNTYVRAMLEYSGFYSLYKAVNGEDFTLGNSSFGQASWGDCPVTDEMTL